MKEKQQYICEKCDKEFNSQRECERHEENCQVIHNFLCDKCGKIIKYVLDMDGMNGDNINLYWNSEECHHINLGRPGYGSGLDGCEVDFNLCDDCLRELIDSFTIEGQEKVINSGSNQYLSSEDWIRLHNGEMSDEEMEENHMYSPRQIKAYEERFPVCSNVKIIVYNDESSGARCPYGASGDKDGSTRNGNGDNHCFGCESFKEREEGQEIPIVKDKEYKKRGLKLA